MSSHSFSSTNTGSYSVRAGPSPKTASSVETSSRQGMAQGTCGNFHAGDLGAIGMAAEGGLVMAKGVNIFGGEIAKPGQGAVVGQGSVSLAENENVAVFQAGTGRVVAHVRNESRFPVLTTGSIRPASIMAICLAKVDSAKTSPLRGPVCVNMRVITTFCP